jgi:DNA-binding NarL/FixJ family response regulator
MANTANAAKIRVLCVDDHPLVRQGIIRTLALSADVTVVAEAATGQEAMQKYFEHRPDVTLMDLEMPRMSGLQAIRAIRQAEPHARIVVLTVYQGDEDIYQALQLGAAGYLLKDTVPQDLIRVIREVHAGQRSIPPDVQAKLEARAHRGVLSMREVQVLELLARGMRNKEVAAELGITEDTARAHIKSILAKLQVHDRTAALAEGLRRGLVRLG